MAINQVTLVGNVGSDPRMSTYGQESKKKASFTLATTFGVGDRQRTDWHRVTAFDRVAEVIGNNVTKGTKLMVLGRIQYGSYMKDGVEIPTADIIADRVELCGKRPAGGAQQEDGPDLPF